MKTTVIVAEAEGRVLDYLVATAMNIRLERYAGDFYLPGHIGDNWTQGATLTTLTRWSPSTDWAQGGPLIEKFEPWLSPPVEDSEDLLGWDAEIYDKEGLSVIGSAWACPTALVAICRAVVAAKLGDKLDIQTGDMEAL